MEDGQVEICHYNAESIEQAYETIINERATSNDDSGHGLLQKFCQAEMEPHANGTKYTAVVQHTNSEARAKHEQMGFK